MPSFGEQLKREREKRSITLDDISVTTKISTRMLRALEEDHFEQLPGGIFNKGFIRAYAKCVGLDEDQIIAEYLVASGEEEPPSAALPEPPNRREEPAAPPREDKPWSIPWGSLAIVLLLAAVGLAVWRNRTRFEAEQAVAPPVEPAVNAPAPAQPAPQPRAEDTPATPAPAPMMILVRAHDDCWISATADGKNVFTGMLTANGVKKVSAQHQAVIKAGNVGAVDISFNGTKVPTDGQPGQVKAFSFDESGLSTVTSTEAPAQNR
jgi:cytoskeletal protein RodZ